MNALTDYIIEAEKEHERIDKQCSSGYLSKKKIINMQPTELIENKKLIEKEIEKRGLNMLFGI